MRIVDDQYLLLSRTGRPSAGLQERQRQAGERQARERLARQSVRPARERGPVVVRLPVRRAIHLVPRGRSDA